MSDVKLTIGPAGDPPLTPASDIVTDARGRKLRVKEPSVLQESRLVRMMGDDAKNVTYFMGYVYPTVMVIEIDGEPVGFPTTLREVEAAIQRLDRDGITAVMQRQQALMPSQDALKDEVKN